MRMSRKFWIISVVAVVIIAFCVLLLPLPKTFSVTAPAVRRDNYGNFYTTVVSWEGRYLDYLIKRDRLLEGAVTLGAGSKAEVERPFLDVYELPGGMKKSSWDWLSDGGIDISHCDLYFGREFEWVVVVDDDLGTFFAPETGESGLNALIENLRRVGIYLNWMK